MVIERVRKEGELDHLRWYCESCGDVLHDASFQLEDLGSQLKPVIDRVFPFDEAREALAYWSGGRHFGKVCVEL